MSVHIAAELQAKPGRSDDVIDAEQRRESLRRRLRSPK